MFIPLRRIPSYEIHSLKKLLKRFRNKINRHRSLFKSHDVSFRIFKIRFNFANGIPSSFMIVLTLANSS
jgi:hypothetical protein